MSTLKNSNYINVIRHKMTKIIRTYFYCGKNFLNNLYISIMNSDQQILILGAGISGVTAAKTLKELGYSNFKIIEGAA